MTAQKWYLIISMLFFMNCTFRQSIRFNLPKESSIDYRIACDTVSAFLSRKEVKKPYKLESIETDNGVTSFVIFKGEWGHVVQLDSNYNVVKYFNLVYAY